jgi:hypothetical protein
MTSESSGRLAKYISKHSRQVSSAFVSLSFRITVAFIMGYPSLRASTTSSSCAYPPGSIFPQAIGIYQPTSKPHLVLAHTLKETHSPIFYISTNSPFCSTADKTLHHGPTKSHPSLTSASFKGCFLHTSYDTRFNLVWSRANRAPEDRGLLPRRACIFDVS